MPGWEETEAKIKTAHGLLFSNRPDAAEACLKEAIKGAEEESKAILSLVHAMIPAVKATPNLAPGQLVECLKRLKQVHAIPAVDKNVIGRKVVHALTSVLKGGVQCVQFHWSKGTASVFTGVPAIQSITSEGLNFEGSKKYNIRSCSLLTMGIFHILADSVSKTFVNMSSAVESLEASKEEGLKYILECWKENGAMAPFAALLLLAYTVDTKSFLEQEITSEDKNLVSDILAWAKKEFPNCAYFIHFEAEFLALTKNVAGARKVLESGKEYLIMLSETQWAARYKSGLYSLCEISWSDAGEEFQAALDVVLKNDLSMVPYSASLAMLCYLQIGESLNALNMAEVIEDYKNQKEGSGSEYREIYWARQDQLGLSCLLRYYENGMLLDGEVTNIWPLLDLAELMVVFTRVTHWMSKQRLTELYETLLDERKEREASKAMRPDDIVRLSLVQMSLSILLKEYSRALKHYQEALSNKTLESKTKNGSFHGKGFGAMFYMHFLAAKVHNLRGNRGGKDCLQLIKDGSKKYTLYQYLVFKAAVLHKTVLAESDADEVEEVEVGAGKAMTLSIPITEKNDFRNNNSSIMWNWASHGKEVKFDVSIEEDGKRKEVFHINKAKFHVGEVVLEDLPKECMVHLTWRNESSVFRSKKVQVHYSVWPLPPMLTRWGVRPHLEA